MAAVVLYEYADGMRFGRHADAATAYKHAVNELIAAVHDTLPTAPEGEVRETLQRAFTLLSERSVPYEERYRRGRSSWQRVRLLAEGGGLRLGPRQRSAALHDVLVLEEPSVKELATLLGGG